MKISFYALAPFSPPLPALPALLSLSLSLSLSLLLPLPLSLPLSISLSPFPLSSYLIFQAPSEYLSSFTAPSEYIYLLHLHWA